MKLNRLAIAGAMALAIAPPARADFLDDLFGAADHFPGATKMIAPRHRHARVSNVSAGRRSYHHDHFPSVGNMVASFYGGGERLNARTASGEAFRPGALTAAHRSLPFGTRLHVCYARCVVVRINDRGPAAWTGRSLDLSRGAARAVGLPGVARVSVSRVGG